MSELGPQARALLYAARKSTSPTPAEAARLWDRLSGALPSGAPSSGATGMGTKIAMAIAIVAAIGGGALLLAPSRSASPMTFAAPDVSEPAVTPTLTRASVPAIAEQPAPPPLAAVPVEQLPRAPLPRVAPVASTSAAPDDNDITLVRAAYVALRTGDASRALALVDEHARRYPASALSAERDATRVLALCALGQRDQARSALQRFKKSFPSSSQLARTCVDDEMPR